MFGIAMTDYFICIYLLIYLQETQKRNTERRVCEDESPMLDNVVVYPRSVYHLSQSFVNCIFNRVL